MKLTKQRLMEMAGLMTEEEQHLKMPFANNLPQGPKRIEWYGKHLAKMMTPADQEGHEGLLAALLDNPEDFPQNWRVAPEGEVDYIESVADEIIAFANDYTDMPGFKGTRNALAGLGFDDKFSAFAKEGTLPKGFGSKKSVVSEATADTSEIVLEIIDVLIEEGLMQFMGDEKHTRAMDLVMEVFDNNGIK